MKGFFITGIDTGCGKTHAACELIDFLKRKGKKVAPFKPVASGVVNVGNSQKNDDAIKLINISGQDWNYKDVNPFCFHEPVSPHISSKEDGVSIDMKVILDSALSLKRNADVIVAEGAGGWMVPLSDHLDVCDLAVSLGLPVIMVVGLRLGCLNHARLTEQAIMDSKVNLRGWIATHVDKNMARIDENIRTLEEKLVTPCLGRIPYNQKGEFKETLILETL